MYKNLIGEMAKEKVTIEAVAKLLKIHRNSVAYKLNEGAFYIDEAEKIHDNFFPDKSMKMLFKKSDSKQNS